MPWSGRKKANGPGVQEPKPFRKWDACLRLAAKE